MRHSRDMTRQTHERARAPLRAARAEVYAPGVGDVKPMRAEVDVALPPELRAPGGAVATLEARPEGEVLRVRDREGRLLLEVHEDGSVVLRVSEGDLRLISESGRVHIEGREGVHVSGPRVTIEAAHLRQVVGVLETHARRIVEKARDAYRDVEGISQLRAGQIRVAAVKTFRVLAERVRMRAKKDAKVQGEKIYLG
jgi:hypothetical protein